MIQRPPFRIVYRRRHVSTACGVNSQIINLSFVWRAEAFRVEVRLLLTGLSAMGCLLAVLEGAGGAASRQCVRRRDVSFRDTASCVQSKSSTVAAFEGVTMRNVAGSSHR